MKIKIIRKILAFAIVVSTVATMPGVASAIPKKSDPSAGKESKTNAKKSDQGEEEEEEEINTNEIKLNKQSQAEINEEEEEINTNEIKLNKQLQDEINEEEEEKLKSSKMIAELDEMLRNVSFDGWDKSKEPLFLDYVNKLSGIYHKRFRGFFENRKADILGLLSRCDRKDNRVAEICCQLCDRARYLELNLNELDSIADIFLGYESQFDGRGDEYEKFEVAHVQIWREVYQLFQKYEGYLFSDFYSGQIALKFMQILHHLTKYIGCNPYYDVLLEMDYLAQSSIFWELFSPQQISDTIDAMYKLLNSVNGEEVSVVNYVNIIVGLAENCQSIGCVAEQVSKLRDIAVKLICDEKFSTSNIKNGCVKTILRLKETGILAGLSPQQNLKILYKLAENIDRLPYALIVEFDEKCSMSIVDKPWESTSKDIISYFGRNIDYNEFKCDEEHAKKTVFIINELISASETARKNPLVFDVLNRCVNVNQCSVYMWVLVTLSEMSWDKSMFYIVKLKMPQILDILKKCALTDAGQLPVTSIVASFINNGFIKGASNDEKKKLVEILNECFIEGTAHSNVMYSLKKLLFYPGNSYDVSCSIIKLLLKFSKTEDEKSQVLEHIKHFLSSLDPNELRVNWQPGNLSEVLNFLLEHYDNSKMSPALYITGILVHAGLIGCDKTDMELINKILIKYSQNKFWREFIVDFIGRLFQIHYNDGAFKSEGYSFIYDYSEIEKIMSILDKCSNDCDGDIIIKVMNVVRFMKSFYKNVKNDYKYLIIKNLILFMNKFTNSNVLRSQNVNFISELLRDGCFSKDYVFVTLDLLNKCSRYASNDLKNNILIIVGNLIRGEYINSENFELCQHTLEVVMLNCANCSKWKETFALIDNLKINSKFGK